jgi:hypothetical protein
MQQPLIEYLRESELAQPWEAVETAETLEAMMAAGGELARARVLWLMGQVLERRAAQPMSWPGCEACGQRLQSKGWAPRQWTGRGRDSEVEAARRALSEGVQVLRYRRGTGRPRRT